MWNEAGERSLAACSIILTWNYSLARNHRIGVSQTTAMMRVLLLMSALAIGCTTSDSDSFTKAEGNESSESARESTEHRVLDSQAECAFVELTVGEIDVDFHGGHSNISGPVSITVCRADVESISFEDRRRLLRAFEVAAGEYWLGFLFSCRVDSASPKHIVEWHADVLTSLNTALGRSVVQEYDCRGTFAEAL
jgi:hypothetical protein